MLLEAKGLRLLFVLSFLFLIAGMTSELVNVAGGAAAPLAPSVYVSPNHVSLGEEITLVVKVQVNAKSNVSTSKPLVMGAGDASLLSEEASVIAEAGEVARLVWTYNATQVGTIYFSLRISVTNLVDGNVTLSESLSSREIGVSRSSRTFLLGLAIMALYVLLSSKFGEFKPKVSFFELMGRFFGLSMAILFFIVGMLVGYFIVPLGQTIEIQRMVTLGIFSSILSVIGLLFCREHKKHIHARMHAYEIEEKGGDQALRIEKPGISHTKPVEKIQKIRRRAMMTDLGGLLIVILGLSGFFLYLKAYFEMVLIIAVGILAIAKECMEMGIER